MCQPDKKSNVISVAFQQMFKYYGLYKYFQTEICQCFTLKRPIYILLLLFFNNNNNNMSFLSCCISFIEQNKAIASKTQFLKDPLTLKNCFT